MQEDKKMLICRKNAKSIYFANWEVNVHINKIDIQLLSTNEYCVCALFSVSKIDGWKALRFTKLYVLLNDGIYT